MVFFGGKKCSVGKFDWRKKILSLKWAEKNIVFVEKSFSQCNNIIELSDTNPI